MPDLAIAKQASSLISFNPLEAPPVYSEETLVPRRTLLGARMLETRIANDTALTSNDFDMESPQVETLFAPTERPRLAGRVYTEGADSIEPDDALRPRQARGANEIAALQTQCRHGIAKASCSIRTACGCPIGQAKQESDAAMFAAFAKQGCRREL